MKYKDGCDEFAELAFDHLAINNKISYPCRDCKNKKNARQGQRVHSIYSLRGGIKITDFPFSQFLENTMPSKLSTRHSRMSKYTARIIIAC